MARLPFDPDRLPRQDPGPPARRERAAVGGDAARDALSVTQVTLLQTTINFCFSWGYWALASWLPELLARRGLSFDLQLTPWQMTAAAAALDGVGDLRVALCHTRGQSASLIEDGGYGRLKCDPVLGGETGGTASVLDGLVAMGELPVNLEAVFEVSRAARLR